MRGSAQPGGNQTAPGGGSPRGLSCKTRVGILISGRGSNMRSLVEAARAEAYPAEIAGVLSNRPEAPGLAWAEAAGLAAAAVDHRAFAEREAFEAALEETLLRWGVEVIACAGFLRILTPGFVARWSGRILNIHPSLLPAFKGLDTHRRALAAGVKITGCTVHLVEAALDCGPIVAQAAVPILDGDTADALAARVLAAEHRLYPHALRLFLEARTGASVEESAAALARETEGAALFSPPLRDGKVR